MRIPRVRLTVRRLMVVVAIAALPAWLAIGAIRVVSDPEGSTLHHFWIWRAVEYAPPHLAHMSECRAPFWPRYWRSILGEPWPGTYRCPCGESGPITEVPVGRLTLVMTKAGDVSAHRWTHGRDEFWSLLPVRRGRGSGRRSVPRPE
jgi:hypothetical protein